MLTYMELARKPAVFKCFVGLDIAAFDELLPAFVAAYEAHLDEIDAQREQPRQRARGAGRKSMLATPADKLVCILFYFRHYPVQTVHGFFFGIGQPQANEWIQRLTKVLNTALGYEMQLPARSPRDLAAVLAACPGLEFIIDGVERPIRRPKDKAQQKEKYSGKKKRHTVKNNVITAKCSRKILGLSPTVEGKRHDKKLADEQAIDFPAGSHLWQDTGFQGYQPDKVITHQPQKKPRGGELTDEQRQANTRISAERISVEHAIGGVKLFGIVKDIYRNLKLGFDDLVMETACGLYNFRVDHLTPTA